MKQNLQLVGYKKYSCEEIFWKFKSTSYEMYSKTESWAFYLFNGNYLNNYKSRCSKKHKNVWSTLFVIKIVFHWNLSSTIYEPTINNLLVNNVLKTCEYIFTRCKLFKTKLVWFGWAECVGFLRTAFKMFAI